MFSADELAQLRGFPEPARAELIRYFTLTPADEAFVRKFRGQDNVMGVAVQLCTLPWLGFVPDNVPAAPAAAVARLSERLGIAVGELRGYGARGQTRTGHFREVSAYLGWRQVDTARWKNLEEFLFARAMEHDSPEAAVPAGVRVPVVVPEGLVPARWAGYLEKAPKDGDVTAYRHYWELCVLMALRDGLRSGDVHVPGSRRYADPASFLLTPQQWEPQRLEFCHVTGKPASAADALALANDELHAALSDLEAQLARGGGPGEVRLNGDGELVVPPLAAEDVPAEAEALRAELGAMLPRVPIASVLVEADARTGFTDHLAHAGGKVARPPDLKRNLLYVIIAEATNMGLGAMAESCGVSYDVLAWTAEWYFREETLEAANAAIVNYHHRLPMTQAFGTGTLSSSDGQRFPVKGKSLTAAHLSRYFAPRPGHLHLHPRLGPALDVRHQGDRRDLAGKPQRARRHPGQPDRPARHRARHRHPRRDAGELRAVRPGVPPAVPAHPGPGQDHPLPHRAASRLRGPLPGLRAPAHPPAERGPDHRHVGRPAAGRRLGQGGAHVRRPGRRRKLCSSKRQQQRARIGDQGE